MRTVRKHFHQYVMSTGLLRETAQMYEIFLQTALKLRGIASKYQSVPLFVPETFIEFHEFFYDKILVVKNQVVHNRLCCHCL